MSLAQELGQRKSVLSKILSLPYGKIAKVLYHFFLLSFLFSQCAALNILSDQSKRQPVLQVGKGQELVEAEEIPEEKNRELFIRETLAITMSSSPFVPKEFDPDCSKDPNCSQGKSRNMKAFGHDVPAMQLYASYLASAKYQPVLIKQMIARKPKNFSRGASLEYRPDYVSEVIEKNKSEKFATVIGADYYFDPNGNLEKSAKRMYEITFREVASPSIFPRNDAQKAISNIRRRGYEVTRIRPIEG